MIKYLLDTNICIYIIKQKPANVINKFLQLEVSDIALSSITVGELFYGVNKSTMKEKNLEALREFMLPLEILNFDDKDAFVYGKVRSDLERVGTPIGSLDMLIAAQALARDLTLASNNTKEFERLNGLKIENWV